MQHSLFDRIYLAFLAILIISFGFLIMFISYFARRSLISERIDTLSNEAQLIAKQSLTSYLEGKIDENTMADFMDYYSNMLKADIWYVDNNGTIIAKSNRKVVEKPATSTSTELTEEASENAYADINSDIPRNIYMINGSYKLNDNFSLVGNFYGIFNTDVITVNMPVNYFEDVNSPSIEAGALILHASTTQINDAMNDILSFSLIPCLVIIVIAFSFIAIISRKIIRPIKHLSNVARDYSEGNFDVETGIK